MQLEIIIKPQSVVRPLTYYFRLLPSPPVHLSFACRHIACLILSTQPATPSRIRQAICSTIHKICTGSNDRFGFKLPNERLNDLPIALYSHFLPALPQSYPPNNLHKATPVATNRHGTWRNSKGRSLKVVKENK